VLFFNTKHLACEGNAPHHHPQCATTTSQEPSLRSASVRCELRRVASGPRRTIRLLRAMPSNDTADSIAGLSCQILREETFATTFTTELQPRKKKHVLDELGLCFIIGPRGEKLVSASRIMIDERCRRPLSDRGSCPLATNALVITRSSFGQGISCTERQYDHRKLGQNLNRLPEKSRSCTECAAPRINPSA
jgi:hypothetical protein